MKTTSILLCALLLLAACTAIEAPSTEDYNEQTLVCYEAYDYENKVCLDTEQFAYDCYGQACMEQEQ